MAKRSMGVEAQPHDPAPGDDQRVQKIKECFRAWDTDGSGYITKCELTRVLERLLRGPSGAEVNHVDIEQLMREADKDGNGKIEYDEFLDWLTRPGAGISHTNRGVELFDLADVLRPLFEVYDQNGDGTISRSEFEECHLILQNSLRLAPGGERSAKPGIGVLAGEAAHVFSAADRDRNQTVSFEEFVDWQRRALRNDGLSNDDLAELLPALARQLGRVFKVSQAQENGILREQKADERVLKRIIQNLANFTRDLWNEDKLASNSIQGKHHYVNRWTEPPVGLNINRLKAKHLMLQGGVKLHKSVDFAGFRVLCVPEVAVPEAGQRRWLGKVVPESAAKAGRVTGDDASYYVYEDLVWSVSSDLESEFEDAVEKLAPELRIFCLLKLEANFGLKIRWEEILAGLEAAVELGYMTTDQLQRYVTYMQKIVVKQARARDGDDSASDDDAEDDASSDSARQRRASRDDAELASELLAQLVVPPRTVMATMLDHGILNTSSALADFLMDARSL